MRNATFSLLVTLIFILGGADAKALSMYEASAAYPEPGVAQYPGGHAMVIGGLGSFVFQGDGLFTVDEATNSGTLSGTLVHKNMPNRVFVLDATVSGLLMPGDPGHAPPDSPKLELLPSAYVGGGGSIDPDTWSYFTALSGTLTGQQDFAGAMLDITRFGPAFQYGEGANGKNSNNGAATWIDVALVSQGQSFTFANAYRGDFNLDLRAVPEPGIALTLGSVLGLVAIARQRSASRNR